MKSNQEYKNQALALLKGNWGKALGVSCLYMIIAGGLSLLTLIPTVGHCLYILSMLVTIPLAAGFYWTFLQLTRGDNNLTTNMFRGSFDRYGRTLGGLLLAALIVVAWSLPYFICYVLVERAHGNLALSLAFMVAMLVFLVPMVIAAMTYLPVNFMVNDRADLPTARLPRESRKLMKGRKWKLFCLMLSFIGWKLLILGVAMIPLFAGIFQSFGTGDMGLGYMAIYALVILVGIILLMPYMYTTLAVWYDDELAPTPESTESTHEAPIVNLNTPAENVES